MHKVNEVRQLYPFTLIFDKMIVGPSAVCLMALVVLVQGAAVKPQQPPLQPSHHGGSHAPIKVAKRQEKVENPELVTADTAKEEPKPTQEGQDGQAGPDAVAAGGKKTSGNRVCMSCRCPR